MRGDTAKQIVHDDVLDAWAEGLTRSEIADRLQTTQYRVEQIVRVARDAGDSRCVRRRKPGTPARDPAPDVELRREILRAQREAQGQEDLNVEILAALEAEPRPAGTPWGYPQSAPRGAMIGAAGAAPRQVVDITHAFFGDPPPGCSALDMRG